MAGTVQGGKQAAATIKQRYGTDYYKKIGRTGGKLGTTGGFAGDPERARIMGSLGGKARTGKSYPRNIKLWQLEKGAKLKIKAQRSDQDKSTEQIFIFDHIDGMYSYIVPIEGEGILHLLVSTPLRRHKGYWCINDTV